MNGDQMQYANKMSLTLLEIDEYLIEKKNPAYEVLKFDLVETREHAMNLGFVYKIVFRYRGEVLYMNDNVEFGHDIYSEQYYENLEYDRSEFEFSQCQEVMVVDYEYKK